MVDNPAYFLPRLAAFFGLRVALREFFDLAILVFFRRWFCCG
jgi:hypothetical protein